MKVMLKKEETYCATGITMEAIKKLNRLLNKLRKDGCLVCVDDIYYIEIKKGKSRVISIDYCNANINDIFSEIKKQYNDFLSGSSANDEATKELYDYLITTFEGYLGIASNK